MFLRNFSFYRLEKILQLGNSVSVCSRTSGWPKNSQRCNAEYYDIVQILYNICNVYIYDNILSIKLTIKIAEREKNTRYIKQHQFLSIWRTERLRITQILNNEESQFCFLDSKEMIKCNVIVPNQQLYRMYIWTQTQNHHHERSKKEDKDCKIRKNDRFHRNTFLQPRFFLLESPSWRQ